MYIALQHLIILNSRTYTEEVKKNRFSSRARHFGSSEMYSKS